MYIAAEDIMRPPLTVEELDADLDLLYRYEEDRQMTQAMLAAQIGLSQSQLSRRLARARRYRAERHRQDQTSNRALEPLDLFDFPYMELVDRPRRRWYSLESDQASQSNGRVHIGDRIEALDGGQLNGEVGGPTRYEPDPRLKGGRS